MPKAKKNKQTGRMEAVRSHSHKRKIQNSDAQISAARDRAKGAKSGTSLWEILFGKGDKK